MSVTRADGSVEIAVSDTGIGIAPEDQEAIFEEFRQVGSDYTRKREGTGLGLPLAQAVRRAARRDTSGSRARWARGSTFTFSTSGATMAGELILIVEDNEKNRKLERDVLQFHGYRTVEAETGEEGVRLARESVPALDPHGHPAAGHQRHRGAGPAPRRSVTRAIPVIAVTASAMTQDRQKIMAAGFDGYQSKPINVKEFVAAVRQMLDRPARADSAT